MGRIRKIKGPDGALIPFESARIAASIDQTIRSCGAPNQTLAEELAGVVSLFLDKHFTEELPPTVVEVREMVVKVLRETGHTRMARVYKRQTANAPTPSRAGGVEEAQFLVLDGTTARTVPWSAIRLQSRLLRLGSVDAPAAGRIVQSIRTGLNRLGLSTVSPGLIRELVVAELEAAGFSSAARAIGTWEVSRKDVDETLFPQTENYVEPEERVAGLVLGPHALEEVFSPAVRHAHHEGRLHIMGLEHPQRVEEISLSARGPLLSGCTRADEFLLELMTLLQALRPSVRERLVVRDFSEAVACLSQGTGPRGVHRFVDRLLTHLTREDVFARPVFPSVVLEVRLPQESEADADAAVGERLLATALLGKLLKTPGLSGRLGLTFVLGQHDADRSTADLDGVLKAARRHRGVTFRLDREDNSSLSPDNLTLDVGAVALNVPVILGLHETEELGDLGAAMEGPAHLALEALREKYWFLRRSAPQTLKGILAQLPGGTETVINVTGHGGQILLWGLPHALSLLEGRGLVTDGTGVAALEALLGGLDYHMGSDDGDVEIGTTIGGLTDRAVRTRFLSVMEDGFPGSIGLEMQCAARETPADSCSLPLKGPLLGEANRSLLTRHFTQRLTRGLPLPVQGADEVTNGAWLGRLMTQTGLVSFELEERGEQIEVQEALFDAV